MNIKDGAAGFLIRGLTGSTTNVMKLQKLSTGIMPVNPLDPLTKSIVDKILEVIFEDNSKNSSSITEEDSKQISQLIAQGREQGLEELDIRISKDLGAKLEASATLPIEVPVNASAALEKKSNGEYCIKVKYAVIKASEGDEKVKYLRELHQLHKDGILTDEEYTEAKKKAIEKF